ncbi:carboxypeptidase-like regulatory domain-containing protein [Myxococcus stipitatus]|uniref:carboxypeptidase regulatory-like domain-containing protein n=1 Tax=Myxococcus stipitatus TaxID=83455 RepID=UPI001F487391|nr:carboxypeptidase regulatory-like domain-containing protein [Myxococcus stipitatus]MCE9668600.1 carboxypeptidase-like regulatory domain-containing protein [Myxococcus stipitatus]
MRKALGASVGVGVLLVAAGLGSLLVGCHGAPPSVEQSATPQATAPATPAPIIAEAVPEPKEPSTSIQGVVIGPMGPVPNARITATYTVPSQTLSTLTCGNLSKSRMDSLPFTQCPSDVASVVLERILAHEGAAEAQSETESAEDGTFTLPHVSTGPVTLWVIGPHGAAMRPGVVRGTSALQLPLEPGQYLEGQVVDETGAPQVGARVTAMHLGTTRFFDTRTQEGGRYRLGPLPKAEYLLAFAMEGRPPTLRHPEQAGRRPVVLATPRRVQGRVTDGGEPVANATVQLRHDPAHDEAGWETASPDQKQLTDDQGRFTFEDLTPHRFQLSVSHGGRHALGDVDLGGPRPVPEVALKLGTALMLEGDVRNEEGTLLATATATLRSHDPKAARPPSLLVSRGHYRVGPVKPGTWHLTVSAPGYRSAEYPARKLALGQRPLDVTLAKATDLRISGWLVDAQDVPLEAVPIHVSSTGETVTTDAQGRFTATVPTAGSVVLTAGTEGTVSAGQTLTVQAPASELRWVLRQGARVRGRVLGEKGQNLYRLSVRVWREGDTRSPIQSTLTNSLGLFQLTGLNAGRHVIEVIDRSDGMERTASRAVVLGEREQAEVELQLEAGPSLSGLVVDAQGTPLPGAEVCARTPPEARPSWRRDAASPTDASCLSSDAQGRFAWSHLPSGEVELDVDKPGFRLVPPRSSGGEPAGQGLRVPVGATDVRLVLAASGVVKGRVLGPDGAPLPRFQVLGEEVVSPQGTFIVPREAVSQGTLDIAASGLTTLTRRADFRRETDVVDLGDLRMSGGRRVRGRVLDAKTSEPIRDAVVIPSREPIRERLDTQHHRPGATETDSDGAFEFVRPDDLPLLLHVEADGYPRHRQVLGPRQEKDLTVRLEKLASVQVDVIDSKGQPGVANLFFDREGDTLDLHRAPVRMADARAGVRVDLEPGTYRVQAVGTGDAPDRFAPQRLNVPRGGGARLTLRALREGATLELTVKNGYPRSTYLLPLGRPFSPSMLDEDFSLRSRALPESPRAAGTTMQTFQSLPPGKLTLLVVEDQGRGYHVEELDIPARGTVKRTVTAVWRPRVFPQ